jgi:hypothetical protein
MEIKMKKIIYTIVIILSSNPLMASWSYRDDWPAGQAHSRVGPVLNLDLVQGGLPDPYQSNESGLMTAVSGFFRGLDIFGWSTEETPDEVYLGEYEERRAEMTLVTQTNPTFVEKSSPPTEVPPAKKTTQLVDILMSNPKMAPGEVLELIDSEDVCLVALGYLDKSDKEGTSVIKEVNFSKFEPPVLPGFIAYLNLHQGAFGNIQSLTCQGHILNPQQTIDLLKIMSGPSRPEVALDLSPGKECNHHILVLLAAGYAHKYAKLTINIGGANLPKGYEDLDLPANLTLKDPQIDESAKAEADLEKMRDSLAEDVE